MAKYLPINWQNGMKINQQHFVGLERAARAELQLYFSSFIHASNYGILPDANNMDALDWFLKLDQSGQVIISLVKCRAVTRSGVLIDIEPEQQHLPTLKVPVNDLSSSFSANNFVYIYLNINPFERKPHGEPSIEVNTHLKPNTVPSVFLSYGALSDQATTVQNGSAQLVIGRLKLSGGTIEKDENYLPPCTSIAALQQMKDVYDGWQSMLQELFHNCKKTIAHARNMAHSANQRVEIGHGESVSVAPAIVEFSLGLLQSLADVLPAFQQNYSARQQYPPENVGYYLMRLQQVAYKTSITFEMMSKSAGNILLNYFSESLHEKRSIQAMSGKLIDLEYRHESSAEIVIAINAFLKYYTTLYNAQKGLPSKDYSWRKEEEPEIGIIINEDKPDLNINTLTP